MIEQQTKDLEIKELRHKDLLIANYQDAGAILFLKTRTNVYSEDTIIAMLQNLHKYKFKVVAYLNIN